MYKLIILALLTVLLAACATIPSRLPVHDIADREYIASVWQDSLRFSMPDNATAELAWDRAMAFVALYGTRIDNYYSFAIQTVLPTYQIGEYVPVSYSLTRLKEAGRVYFTIIAYNLGTPNAGRLNGRMLSRYMRTGQLRDHLLNLDLEISNIINPYNP